MSEATRLKHIATLRTQVVDDRPRPLVALEHVRSGSGGLISSDFGESSPPTSGVADVSPGDVLFGKLRPYLAKTWVADRPVRASTELLCLRPNPAVDSRWLGYVVASTPLIDWAVATSDGSKMPRTSWERLSQFRITVPAGSRQLAIADYLDRETARIDAVVSARQRQTALLHEGIEAYLRRLVNPRMDGARFIAIRRVLKKRSRIASLPGVVTAFRDGTVSLRDRRREEGFTESTTRSDYQGVRRGDVVFHGLDGFAGAIGVSEDDGMCSPVYHVCSALPGFDPGYAALALRGLALSGYLAVQSGNVRERAVDFRNWDTLAQIAIPVPDLDQQRLQAGTYADRRRWTDELIHALRRQVRLFQERRRALITAAVTGQLDIPEAA